MPLNPHQSYNRGSTLRVIAVPGWGWQFCVTKIHQQALETPSEFTFELDDRLVIDGEIVGIIGKCSTDGHIFFGMWVLAVPRLDRAVTLGEVTPFNLLIAPSKPRLSNLIAPPHPASVIADEFPQWRGYANAIQIDEPIEQMNP